MQTNYKVQGATFISATVDLKRTNKFSSSIHKQFCSTYIQLLHLHSFASLELLQSIKMTNIANQSYPLLAIKDVRLEKLSDQTIKN